MSSAAMPWALSAAITFRIVDEAAANAPEAASAWAVAPNDHTVTCGALETVPAPVTVMVEGGVVSDVAAEAGSASRPAVPSSATAQRKRVMTFSFGRIPIGPARLRESSLHGRRPRASPPRGARRPGRLRPSRPPALAAPLRARAPAAPLARRRRRRAAGDAAARVASAAAVPRRGAALDVAPSDLPQRRPRPAGADHSPAGCAARRRAGGRRQARPVRRGRARIGADERTRRARGGLSRRDRPLRSLRLLVRRGRRRARRARGDEQVAELPRPARACAETGNLVYRREVQEQMNDVHLTEAELLDVAEGVAGEAARAHAAACPQCGAAVADAERGKHVLRSAAPLEAPPRLAD